MPLPACIVGAVQREWEDEPVSEPHTHAPGPLADASVRTACPTDAPAIGAVQATVFRAEYAQVLAQEVLDQLEGPRFAQVWRRSLEQPPTTTHRVLVACAGEQVVGFAALAPAAEDDPAAPGEAGEILVLAVHPEARRQGHGSRLLNAVADTLRAQGLAAVLAWVPAAAETTRGFLSLGGLDPDGAWRDRVVGSDEQTLREVRVWAAL